MTLSRKDAQRAIDRLNDWRNNENEAMTPQHTNSYERTWANDAERRVRGLKPVRRHVLTQIAWYLGAIATLLMIVAVWLAVMFL